MLQGAMGPSTSDVEDKEYGDFTPQVPSVQSAFDIIEGPPLWDRRQDKPLSCTAPLQAKVGTDDDMSDPRKKLQIRQKFQIMQRIMKSATSCLFLGENMK